MSTALDNLRSVLRGNVPANGSLLAACRLEGFGAEAYGAEAIARVCRRSGVRETDALQALSSERGLAYFDQEPNGSRMAVFADTIDSNLLRIWCLTGIIDQEESEGYVSVPSDFDLSQLPDRVALAETDHPDLDASARAMLRDIARRIVDEPWIETTAKAVEGLDVAGLFRRRVFVLRAFSTESQGAALLRVHALQGSGQRKSIPFNVAVLFHRDGNRVDEAQLAVDRAGLTRAFAAPWVPRI